MPPHGLYLCGHELKEMCRGVGGAARQETALLAEGVEVGRGNLGERTVDFSVYGWFPDRLPLDESESSDEEAE